MILRVYQRPAEPSEKELETETELESWKYSLNSVFPGLCCERESKRHQVLAVSGGTLPPCGFRGYC